MNIPKMGMQKLAAGSKTAWCEEVKWRLLCPALNLNQLRRMTIAGRQRSLRCWLAEHSLLYGSGCYRDGLASTCKSPGRPGGDGWQRYHPFSASQWRCAASGTLDGPATARLPRLRLRNAWW